MRALLLVFNCLSALLPLASSIDMLLQNVGTSAVYKYTHL